MIPWQQIDPDGLYADRHKLVLGPHAIEITGDESETIIEACERAFHVLAFSSSAVPSSRSGVTLATPANETSARPMTELMPQRPPNQPTVRPSHGTTTGGTLESIAPAFRSEPRVSNATPPPPHSVSYDSYVVHASSQPDPGFACWGCDTPLYRNTPQCARCSALPTPQGWRRTA